MRLFRALIALGIALAAGCNSSTTTVLGPTSPPTGTIKHVVILIQENRSFNNLFAGFPGATTAMQGLCKPSPQTGCNVAHEVPLKALPLAQGPPSLGGEDICHSHQCFELRVRRKFSARLPKRWLQSHRLR